MKHSLKTSCLISMIVLAATAAAAERKSILRFSDPSRPGRVVVQIGSGDLTVVGTDETEVTVQSDAPGRGSVEQRDDGLRRLDTDSVYVATEKDNVVTILFDNARVGAKPGGGDTSSDMIVTVPRQASVTIEHTGSGDVEVKGLTGDAEIRSWRGDVDLEEFAGGLLVEAMSGDVAATFTRLGTEKPVSITTFRGDVAVRVPEDVKANVRFRTQRGEILTDFSEEALQSHFESTDSSLDIKIRSVNANVSTIIKSDTRKEVRIETVDSVAEATSRASQERERAVADSARAVAEQQRAAERQRAAAEEKAAVAAAAPRPVPAPKPTPLIPPMPPMPPISGGKLVVGTLNGGGAELIVTTLTGDITLRKVE